MTSKVYVKDEKGNKVLWYEISATGQVTWHLTKEQGKKIKTKILANIGEAMSDYAYAHPEAV